MAKVISFAIEKGGVGKTTTTLTVGKELARRGSKVLMIDLDSQASLSQIVGVVMRSKDDLTIANFLGIGCDEVPFEKVVVDVQKVTEAYARQNNEKYSPYTGELHLLPSNILMSGTEEILTQMDNFGFVLKKRLKQVQKDYDYILIDCPPALNSFMKAGIIASDYIVIPVKPELASIYGLTLFIQTLVRLQKAYDGLIEINIAGILLTMCNTRTNAFKEIKEQLELIASQMNTKIFETTIRNSVACSTALGNGDNIIEVDASSPVAKDYTAFIDELIVTISEEKK